MANKPFKTIQPENCSNECQIFGNNHWIKIDYKVPEWEEEKAEPDVEACFMYRGHLYFISEFVRVESGSPFYVTDEEGNQLFDGYSPDSFFSGILVKWGEEEEVKAYTYIS